MFFSKKKDKHRSKRIGLIGALLLFMSVQVAAQSTSSYQAAPVIEIVFSCCPFDYEIDTTRLYSDGRYVREEIFHEKARSGARRRVIHQAEKRLEPDEIAEVVRWANEADFINGDSDYVVTTVLENPDWTAITYRDKAQEKTIRVFNFSRGTAAQKAKVPSSFLKLARWAAPYSDLLK